MQIVIQCGLGKMGRDPLHLLDIQKLQRPPPGGDFGQEGQGFALFDKALPDGSRIHIPGEIGVIIGLMKAMREIFQHAVNAVMVMLS